jgi:PAS domain S-box-containing protein
MTGQRMGAVAPRLVLVATIGLAIGGFHGWIATVIGALTVTVFVEMRVRHQLETAILSSLPAQVAVLDRRGTVIAVNESWTQPSLGASADCSIAPGVNFLDVCRAAAQGGHGDAAAGAAGVAEVCNGVRQDFELEYRQAYADGEGWFVLKAAPLKREAGGAVVTRKEITTGKRAEMLIRENQARFRRLADTLPLAVWMSGIDGAFEYFNRTWLEMTGRPIERELGVGWLETVHPDDRERCMGTYLRAFAARRPFSMEYRVRRYDGQYRWLLDKGAPRYDGETFAGYLGGAIDFTDQRDAEQALRELSGKLIAAQEDERRRIARDLHDSVGQRLALVSVRLHEVRRLLPATGAVAAILAQLWDDSQAVARDVHSLSHRLHSAKLDALGLVAAVAGECREMSAHGILVNFSEAGVPRVSSEVALCLFRIAQEALSNVVKHSAAKTARVTMTGSGDLVVLTVEDGGVGFVADARVEGLGLVSIRERVRSVGGVFAVRSAPGQGTAVEARVPAQNFTSASLDSTPLEELSRTEPSPPLYLSNGSETSSG